MNFNTHSKKLEGQHAFLGASNYHWINYDLDKLYNAYLNYQMKEQGTRIHAFAKDAINLRIKLPKSPKTLNMYVNDAIGYHMIPEQMLYYSDNCFGTCDAISFNRNLLRIHDLKTGVTPASMNQLLVYTALFCLEYHYQPTDIDIELRIYQFDEVEVFSPNPSDVIDLMSKIITFDKEIEKIKRGGDED